MRGGSWGGFWGQGRQRATARQLAWAARLDPALYLLCWAPRADQKPSPVRGRRAQACTRSGPSPATRLRPLAALAGIPTPPAYPHKRCRGTAGPPAHSPPPPLDAAHPQPMLQARCCLTSTAGDYLSRQGVAVSLVNARLRQGALSASPPPPIQLEQAQAVSPCVGGWLVMVVRRPGQRVVLAAAHLPAPASA